MAGQQRCRRQLLLLLVGSTWPHHPSVCPSRCAAEVLGGLGPWEQVVAGVRTPDTSTSCPTCCPPVTSTPNLCKPSCTKLQCMLNSRLLSCSLCGRL